MSALGHKRTYAVQKAMSATPNSDRESGLSQNAMPALPPKADMYGALVDICFGPKQTFAVRVPTDFDRFGLGMVRWEVASARIGIDNVNSVQLRCLTTE
jgi:hypothetical protein